MNIQFKNLGKIKDTSLELKPLTVIIGPNNTNKTYMAYSIYGIHKFIRNRIAPFSNSDQVIQEPNIWKLKLDTGFCRQLRTKIRASAKQFQQEMTAYFQDSSKKLFSTTDFSVTLTDTEILSSINLARGTSNYSIGRTRYRVSREDKFITLRPTSKTDAVPIAEEFPMTTGIARTMMMHWAILSVISDPFLLPAERNAFIITYKTLIGGRNREVTGRRLRKSEQATLFEPEPSFRYPAPVEDFLQFLYDSEQERNITSPEEYVNIAAYIEKHLQNTNRTHYRATGLGYELAVEVSKDLTIDLYNASSSIKQLAPLLIYLQQRASRNDLIIIDEPEMNLHPESQAKLLEALAIMVNSGIKVLLTTHSPYVMQHLNNIVLLGKSSASEREQMAKSLYLQDPKALLEKTQVSAYEMKDNKLVSLEDPDYGIRWDTLSDVSVDLQEKYFHMVANVDE